MSKLSVFIITILAIFVPAVVIIVVGNVSGLPMGSVVAVSLTLVSIGILNLRRWRSVGRPSIRFWISLAVGVLFLLGGTVGIVRLLDSGWQWSEGLPLALPVLLGLCVIWLTLRFLQKSAH